MPLEKALHVKRVTLASATDHNRRHVFSRRAAINCSRRLSELAQREHVSHAGSPAAQTCDFARALVALMERGNTNARRELERRAREVDGMLADLQDGDGEDEFGAMMLRARKLIAELLEEGA